MVYGVLAEEALDKSGEIFDYARSKPHFEKWSNDFKERTAGKSVGNLRRMHQPHVAGHFEQMVFNDADKRVEVAAKITDDQDWAKVLAGDYTGFSIGGKYVDTWTDPVAKKLRYEAAPGEGSLVDNPCMYGATFALTRSDGSSSLVKFVGSPEEKGAIERGLDFLRKHLSPAAIMALGSVEKVAEREDASAKEGKGKYGDVKFADETNKKYPIDTAAHIRAAWSYINKEKNASKYSTKDAASIKRKIVAAWKSKIDEDGPRSAAGKSAGADDLKKSHLANVRGLLDCLACCLCCAGDCCETSCCYNCCSACNAGYGCCAMACGDNPQVRDHMQQAAQHVGEAITAIVDAALGEVSGEYDESTGEMAAQGEKTDPPGDLEKIDPATADPPKKDPGAAPAAGDPPKDSPVDAAGKSAPSDELKKSFEALKAQTDQLTKAQDDLLKTVGETVKKAVESAVGETRAAIEKLEKRVEQIASMPAQAGLPVGPAQKLGTGPGGAADAGALVKDAQGIIDAVKAAGGTPAVVQELTLALASRLMPH